MNKELHDSFQKLNDMAKADVKHQLKDAPVGLRLFYFLENNQNRNFRNREVVEAIYKDELQSNDYSVLENRYFKLRKKFLEEYFSAPDTSEEIMAEEEAQHLKARKLFQQGDREQAYNTWVALEKICWEKNIFELLPQVIDNLIFCNQVLNKLERNEELYLRMEEAMKLQKEMEVLLQSKGLL